MGGIVKLTKITSITPQDTGPELVAGPPCGASKTAVSLNLTIPTRPLPAVSARPGWTPYHPIRVGVPLLGERVGSRPGDPV